MSETSSQVSWDDFSDERCGSPSLDFVDDDWDQERQEDFADEPGNISPATRAASEPTTPHALGNIWNRLGIGVSRGSTQEAVGRMSPARKVEVVTESPQKGGKEMIAPSMIHKGRFLRRDELVEGAEGERSSAENSRFVRTASSPSFLQKPGVVGAGSPSSPNGKAITEELVAVSIHYGTMNGELRLMGKPPLPHQLSRGSVSNGSSPKSSLKVDQKAGIEDHRSPSATTSTGDAQRFRSLEIQQKRFPTLPELKSTGGNWMPTSAVNPTFKLVGDQPRPKVRATEAYRSSPPELKNTIALPRHVPEPDGIETVEKKVEKLEEIFV